MIPTASSAGNGMPIEGGALDAVAVPFERDSLGPPFRLPHPANVAFSWREALEIRPIEVGSRGRTRTCNHTVNSRVLYH